ncbi:MAG TPA: Y-family DNA polymerase [Methyloprofundus sp.]|uniref:Y-family DNA polymerase n=1 Tax=Methyloprofundus sp. TaxID=2020875 RepID=UPI001825DE5E|nr:Y-family DNA polymerase [Methyloprofundus sp.]HIG65046.1 Y-family DNA polymerase [Methyloprofundus sp.]HIL79473.1 Y-family DNA polymerase [Methylococcales bacterium]
MQQQPAQPLIALVDCNNFYVSCERVFRPDLINKPVAVLSNNDGCIVARSQEVKDLGIKMATPVHQVQHLINRHKIQLFSSNYTLYADMSNRVMQCLETYAPQLEVYSIDESFLDLTDVCNNNAIAYGQQIKQTVFRTTGIPVCVGLASTKTLAKLANYAAKKWKKTGGVLDLSDPMRRDKLLRLVPVNEVWGIGRQTTKRLQLMGINTAYELARQPVESIQAQFNIVVARTVMELNGISCLALDDIPADKQQIVCSRSFKRRLTTYKELAEALASFCSCAAEKLRKQGSIAGSITVFIKTNRYNANEPQYQRSINILLQQTTSDTRQIVSIAKRLLTEIFKHGYRYQKCGVQLSHIQAASIPAQIDLFGINEQNNSTELMNTIDKINSRFPNGITLSATGINTGWQVPVEYLSPHYTTNWKKLAIVKCH